MRGETRTYPARGTSERAELVARLANRAKFIRLETVRLAEIPGAGHYTGTFSAAELIASLYYAELCYRPDEPGWPERDRLVLSKGHAAIGLYPVLADVGFFDRHLLDDYTRLGSAFGDHPDMRKITGVDFSSGSLGHGLSVSTGMALAGRIHGLAAAERLAATGIGVRVIDVHTIHPLDTGEILAAAQQADAVLTVEEHNVAGGLGSAVAETLADAGVAARFRRLGVPGVHVVLGPPAALYAHYQLDAAGIESAARQLLAGFGRPT